MSSTDLMQRPSSTFDAQPPEPSGPGKRSWRTCEPYGVGSSRSGYVGCGSSGAMILDHHGASSIEKAEFGSGQECDPVGYFEEHHRHTGREALVRDHQLDQGFRMTWLHACKTAVMCYPCSGMSPRQRDFC